MPLFGAFLFLDSTLLFVGMCIEICVEMYIEKVRLKSKVCVYMSLSNSRILYVWPIQI